MHISSVHQEMLSLAAVGSPQGREHLRDVTDIILNYADDICDTPGDVQDDETTMHIASAQEPGDCNELNTPEATL